MIREVFRFLTLAESDAPSSLVADSLKADGSLAATVDYESDAWRALKRIETHGYDAVFVDARGVEADALRFLKVLKEHGVDVACVLIVDTREPEFAGRATDDGACECLTVGEVESRAFPRLLRALVANHALAASARSEAAVFRRTLEEKNDQLGQALHQLRTFRDEALQSERETAIEQLVVTVRHEVNNPLATLVGRAQLLRKRAVNAPDNVREALGEIEVQALRIREIMDKLDLARDGRTTGYLGGRRIKLD